jgi:hypothetical protein
MEYRTNVTSIGATQAEIDMFHCSLQGNEHEGVLAQEGVQIAVNITYAAQSWHEMAPKRRTGTAKEACILTQLGSRESRRFVGIIIWRPNRGDSCEARPKSAGGGGGTFKRC